MTAIIYELKPGISEAVARWRDEQREGVEALVSALQHPLPASKGGMGGGLPMALMRASGDE